MNCAVALAVTEDTNEIETDALVDQAILQFLGGETDGSELFQALYGAPIDEPIPPAMLALVRGARSVNKDES
jgi:hypothetical protein